MQAYPPPAATPQAVLDFETILEDLLSGLVENDAFIEASGVQVISARAAADIETPAVQFHVAAGQNMDYMSFILQGNPQRQTPNAFFAQMIATIITTRTNDPSNLHGQIRGRLRFIFSAPANLLSMQATYPLLHILEILPDQTVPSVTDQKDQDRSALMFRMKFGINDWAWPIVISQPANVTVAPTQSAVFNFGYLIGQKATTFQWQVSENGGSTWADTTDGPGYSGSTTDTLTVLNANVGQTGYQYRCQITNGYSQTITTSPATLSVT